MLTYGVIAGLERMCMPVLFKEISDDLGLSVAQIGTIWGLDPLAGVFIGLPGGLLADRFGVKRMLATVCLLSGIFGALRGLSIDFLTMSVSMFLFGLMAATTPSIAPKVTAQWFSRNQLGLTNALLAISWSVGSMIATMTSATVLSPLLGGWRNVIFAMGIPAIVAGVLWFTTGKEPHDEMKSSRLAAVSFRETLLKVIRLKEVWVIGFLQFTQWGANMGLSGYLSFYLKNTGWTAAGADSAVTLISAASLAGVIPMVILADRIGSRKKMLFFSVVVMSLSLLLLPFARGVMVYVVLVVSCFLRAGLPALFNTLVIEIKGIGSQYGGSAIGLASTIGMIGAFIGPPLGNSFASSTHPELPFFFWAAFSSIGLPLFIFLRKSSG